MRGGKRPNAGRKKGEPTVTLSFRVKKSNSNELKSKIKVLISEINLKESIAKQKYRVIFEEIKTVNYANI